MRLSQITFSKTVEFDWDSLLEAFWDPGADVGPTWLGESSFFKKNDLEFSWGLFCVPTKTREIWSPETTPKRSLGGCFGYPQIVGKNRYAKPPPREFTPAAPNHPQENSRYFCPLRGDFSGCCESHLCTPHGGWLVANWPGGVGGR